MKPKIKPQMEMTLHRDGTVSYWDIYVQCWRRVLACMLEDNVLASFSDVERNKIKEL